MASTGQFDPGQHKPREALDPLPAGWYAARMVASENRENSNKQGSHLWLEFELDENVHPQHKGRKIWDRLNLYHQNQQVVDIAQSQLSGICKAVGHVGILSDSEALHGKPIAIRLKLRPATDKYEASNDVTGYDTVVARFGQGTPVAQGVNTVPVAPPPAAPPPQAGPPQAAAPTTPPNQAQQAPWKQ